MWRNYLTVAVRALAKSKTYAFINIAGLAIGLAACVMILLYVRYEKSYDSWLPDAENTYEFQTYFRIRKDGETVNPDARLRREDAVKKDFPQVEQSFTCSRQWPVVHPGRPGLSTKDICSPTTISSRPSTAARAGPALPCRRPRRHAERGAALRHRPVVGRTLTVISRGTSAISGSPACSGTCRRTSFSRRDRAARLHSLLPTSPQFLTCWGCQSGWVYLKLRPAPTSPSPGAAAGLGEAQHPRRAQRRHPLQPGDDQDWHVVNVRDIHLGKAQDGAMTPGNDRQTIVTFTIIAFLILGMACVNFTNLATARASQRAREVALRKVLGANRKQLITQFLGESVLIAAIAMLLALALVELLLPAVLRLPRCRAGAALFRLGRDAAADPRADPAGRRAGGLYPAFYLSRFQPAQVLKANKSSAGNAGHGAAARNVLVVAQFAVSIGLIICTAVVYAQTVYARTVDPGYHRDGLIQIENSAAASCCRKAEAIVEMSRVPGVVSVGRSGIGVATDNNNNTGVILPGRSEPVNIGNYSVDEGFFGRWACGSSPAAGSTPTGRATIRPSLPDEPDAVRAAAHGARAASTS